MASGSSLRRRVRFQYAPARRLEVSRQTREPSLRQLHEARRPALRGSSQLAARSSRTACLRRCSLASRNGNRPWPVIRDVRSILTNSITSLADGPLALCGRRNFRPTRRGHRDRISPLRAAVSGDRKGGALRMTEIHRASSCKEELLGQTL